MRDKEKKVPTEGRSDIERLILSGAFESPESAIYFHLARADRGLARIQDSVTKAVDEFNWSMDEIVSHAVMTGTMLGIQLALMEDSPYRSVKERFFKEAKGE